MGRVKFWISSGRRGTFAVLACACVFFLSLLLPSAALAQTELGSEDDLAILGTDGTAADPDVEVKGFTVFGSTQANYPGAVVGAGNVVVNGVLAVSSGAYFVGNSTFTGAGKIFINDGSAGQLLRRHSAGYLEWADTSAMGDNLGNHTATQVLQMGAYGVNTSSNVTAARYQINGSTVLAILPGFGSLGVGADAGIVNNAAYNTFTGYRAGYNNTTGNYNTFAGYNAGLGYTAATNSAVFGAEAGLTANGEAGAFFGARAGYKATGVNNSFIGVYSGYNTTTGDNNTFVGSYSGYGNVGGIQNTFMGGSAGYSNTSGDRNTFLGHYSGQSNTAGSENAFVGSYSGYTNTTGSLNTLVGRMAGYYNVAGGSNTVIGYKAGMGPGSSSNEGNSILGYQAGFGLSAGSRNTLLGWQAGDALAAGADNIIIGYDQDASAPAASNELNIGGVLYGNLSAKTIGISTRAPQAALDIVSTGTAANQMAQIWRRGDGVIVGSMSATGVFQAVKLIGDGSGLTNLPAGAGDNLGTHIATQTLNMNSWNIVGVSSVNFLSNVYIASGTAAQRGGVYVSTNLYVAGISTASSYYGDGSYLDNVSTNPIRIGDSYGGGIVFWTDAKRGQALISATADQSASIQWAPTTNFTGAQFDGVGAGKANTVMVSTVTGPGTYAARLCVDYAVTVNGVYYDDWYLPSSAELQLLYAQKTVVGGFGSNSYWSSTEWGAVPTTAWYVYFLNGDVNGYGKTNNLYVRCVRGGPVSAFDHLRDVETVRDGAYLSKTQTFTGGNTFALNVTASSYTATGIGVQAAQLRLDASNNVIISSETSASLGAGVRVSTNMYIVGFASATKYYGDGSGLTSISASDATKLPLAGGTMSGDIYMGANDLYAVSTITATGDITAARYQINGSTVLAILPGADSLGIGVNAGIVNTASYNLFVGQGGPGKANTTGNFNSFLGSGAGFKNTTGANNSFVGSQTGWWNTTGANNSFLGAFAGYFNTGDDNSFVGSNAGYEITTGANNAFFGSNAGRFNVVGSANVIVGKEAGYGVTLNSFSSSTLVGYRAGYGLTTGSDNILLGWQAGDALTTGARNIVVGYNQDASAPSASNELNIGGVLYGDLSAKTIGISTRAPQAALDIVSTGTAANIYAQIWRNGSGTIVSSMTSQGELKASKFIGDGSGLTNLPAGPGDNLGNHVATTTLNMNSWNIVGVSSVNFLSNVYIASGTAAQRGGVYVSTNLYVAGISTASSYYGDGSYLDNVSTNPIRIGDSYGGGVVFWVDPKRNNALIAPTADHPGTIAWSNDASATGATLDGVYAGKANTVMISTMQGRGTYAARFCLDYAVTVNGMYYDDWYLPSKTEMELLYGQRALLGGLSNAWYPTSTEYASDTTQAVFVHGGTGSWTVGTKTAGYYFRCVRGGPVSAFDNSRDAETVRDGVYRSSTQTFTGGNTFALGVTASSYTATGIGVQAAQLRLAAAGGVTISSEASAALGGGVRVSTNVYVVGFSSAAKYYGDGSGLTNLPVGPGDNLGNHTATQALNMSNKAVDGVSSMTITGAGVTGSDPLFTVAGSTLVVLNNGNVGIGTAAPGAALHVSSGGAVASDTVLLLSSGTAAGQELVVVKGDGSVGIGTAAPSRKLHLYDTSGSIYGATLLVDSSRVDANSRVVFSRQGGEQAQIRLYNAGANGYLRIQPLSYLAVNSLLKKPSFSRFSA